MQETLILDASAALRLTLGEPLPEQWLERLQSATRVLAPALMQTEVANALWKLQRAQRLNNLKPQDLLLDACALVDHFHDDRPLLLESIALAEHLQHPVYDCLYLTLARREAGAVLTADRKLQQLAAMVLP